MFPKRDQNMLERSKKPSPFNSKADYSSQDPNSRLVCRPPATVLPVNTAQQLPLRPLANPLSHNVTLASPFDIIRSYNKYWLALPEAAKNGQDRNAESAIQETFSRVKFSIGNLPSFFLSDSNLPSILEPNTRQQLTHQQLSTFIRNFRIPLIANVLDSKPVVVLALPNGPLLGLACLAVSSYYTAVPLNTSGGPHQFRSDVELAGSKAILVLESDVQRLGIHESWVLEAGIQLLFVSPKPGMTFEIRSSMNPPLSSLYSPSPNSGDDIVLLLFTSGTSGIKKIVPVTCFGLLTGAVCVIDSWGLTSSDSCLNMMPLNHVGGLIRNLFAPVLSGGSTILCPAFDPNIFWDITEAGFGTWYYASPSMHMSILAEGNRQNSSSRCQLRLVCNAAGGLLPALAVQLRDTFNCNVLPSYGMTECMPIATPPLDYTLDRIGTSGVGCGPEIVILDHLENPQPAGQVGRIHVRGGPLFKGYLKDGKIDKSAFNKSGWFDTGDLGSLDNDGFLYLTGRGKEVINRGGELISPFEVEEAITVASQDCNSLLFKRVHQVMAFSAPHDLLQECVAVALVTPVGCPRPDIRELHAALKTSLHSTMLPVVVVYIDALPTSNNKIVRIRFGERLDMMPITSEMSLVERHFEAVCPPVNTLLSTKILRKACVTDLELVLREIENHIQPGIAAHVSLNHHDGTPEVFVAPEHEASQQPSGTDIVEIVRIRLQENLDGFLCPSRISYLEHPFPRFSSGIVDEEALREVIKASQTSISASLLSKTEYQIQTTFCEVLGCAPENITSESDFFELGGDSLSAGRLLSILRRDLQVRIPIDQLFRNSRLSNFCDLVENVLQSGAKIQDQVRPPRPAFAETYSSTNPLVLMIHLLPILVFYPMKMAFQWTVLMYSLSTISELWDEDNVAARFLALTGAMLISRVATQIVAPLCGIAFKWMVIGRYKEGIYPMWGPYHTRWWIVQKVLLVCGKGFFRHFDTTRLTYYRFLGAKIGKDVTIEKGTTLGEYDLLYIGDNVQLDRCICRPFAAELNTTMFLGKIVIGKNSTIGLKSHVAAGSVLPEGTVIGANSSSYEMDDKGTGGERVPPASKSHILIQIFCIFPIQVVVVFISSLPWMAGLWGIVSNETQEQTDSVKTVITWWATPHRIYFHYLAQALNVSVRPFVWFGCLVIIKKAINIFCGPGQPSLVAARTQKDNLRAHLLAALIPKGFKSITTLFGSHYEFTSMVVRALGGKVGKRVYWPGTGPSISDYDLLEVGDDVVFGSRTHITTSDSLGSGPVKIGNRAMIADRVILSPGATIEDGAILGSGSYIKRGQHCAANTVWVGNRNGSAVCLSSSSQSSTALYDISEKSSISKETISYIGKSPSVFQSSKTLHDDCEKYPVTIETASWDEKPEGSSRYETPYSMLPVASIYENIRKLKLKASSSSDTSASTPFGRAFYQGQAPYYVLNQFTIFLYSTFTTIFVQLYWNVGTISTIMLSQIMNRTRQFQRSHHRPVKIYIFDLALLSGLYAILSLLAIAVVIAAKWLLMGRRKKGSYDWDKSSYCQRWQVFLTIEAIRRRCFGGIGILGMLTGTNFCVLYFRAMGANIGKDCALFAGGRPSLVFTEPDLLTLGDRVCVDDASLVCHINSRGNFSLNELVVGERCVLRSGSRLLSGARMGKESVLLEHTLIMAGDVADEAAVSQGWPADVFKGNRLKIGAGVS